VSLEVLRSSYLARMSPQLVLGWSVRVAIRFRSITDEELSNVARISSVADEELSNMCVSNMCVSNVCVWPRGGWW
jgi:hypothetical protein